MLCIDPYVFRTSVQELNRTFVSSDCLTFSPLCAFSLLSESHDTDGAFYVSVQPS